MTLNSKVEEELRYGSWKPFESDDASALETILDDIVERDRPVEIFLQPGLEAPMSDYQLIEILISCKDFHVKLRFDGETLTAIADIPPPASLLRSLEEARSMIIERLT